MRENRSIMMSHSVTGASLVGLREDPRLERDANELHAALSELIRVYQFRDREQICCYDLSVTQFYALEALLQGGAISMNALSARLILDKSTASRVVDALERKGYAVREANPSDRRALLIRATAAGGELVGTIRGEIIQEEKRLLADFEPAVRKEMSRLIGRLARAAAGRVDTARGCCTMLG
jgi:MarR family transcriptional regulator, 2-MHQ and catechol-resistance regulon repressor